VSSPNNEYWEKMKAEKEAAESKRRQRIITSVAERMGFISGQDVLGRIDPELGDADDILLEDALRAIGEQSPHLLAPPAPELTATGQPVLASIEEWAALPEDQRLARMDEADALMRGETPGAPKAREPLKSLDEWAALPEDQRLARMDEADALMAQGHH
jgi:hypothetical protein